MKNKKLNNLIKLLISIKDPTLMEDFIIGILTPKELDEIPMRLEIVKKIKEGLPHSQIAQDLGIGVATVTRGSKELKSGRFKVLNEN